MTNSEKGPVTGVFVPQTLNVMHISLLPTFRGEGGIALPEFLERIEDAAVQFGWTENDKKFVLKDRIYGEARELLKENGEEANSYKSMVEVLKKNYLKQSSLNVGIFEFLNFKQPSNMPVERFIAQATLKSKALDFGDIGIEAREVQRKHMLLNMLKSNIKPDILRGVLARDPQDVVELKRVAVLEENAIKMTSSVLNPFAQSFNGQAALQREEVYAAATPNLAEICDKLTAQVISLTEKVEQLQMAQTNSQNFKRDRKKIKCYRCNMEGHIARNCRAKFENKDLN